MPPLPGHEACDVQTGAEALALAMQHDRANRRIVCQLLGGIHQAFEHGLVKRIVLIGAHHRHRCHATGTDPHTNSVFAHAWQLTVM